MNPWTHFTQNYGFLFTLWVFHTASSPPHPLGSIEGLGLGGIGGLGLGGLGLGGIEGLFLRVRGGG